MENINPDKVMIKKKCYCGPQSISLKDLFQLSKPSEHWFLHSNRQIIYTHKGRCGLGLLCQHWNLETGDEVLMPSYNCGTEIDPFLEYGLVVNFYRVDTKTNIDVEDLLKRITVKTKIIYVIHYFGWPQDIEKLTDYCKRNNIYVIEDCALSLFSKTEYQKIGLLGDASIYSFPKTLPVPDGGALTISAENPLLTIPAEQPPAKVILKEILPFIKRWVLRLSDNIGLYGYLPQKITQSRNSNKLDILKTPFGLPAIPESYYYDKNIQNMRCSAITEIILHHTHIDNVIKKRRDNYLTLLSALEKSESLEILYNELPAGVCPLYMPVIVGNRNNISAQLNSAGISAMQWWSGFHKTFDWKYFPEAKYLKDHLMVLPIHQSLDRNDIKYIAEVINKRYEN